MSKGTFFCQEGVCDCMMCPFCNAEMEKGQIEQTHVFFPLQWTPYSRPPGLLLSRKHIVKLTSFKNGGRVIAHRCEACRKIIIDECEEV